MQYNKLVRDKIPEIIQQNGETPIVQILGDAEYSKALRVKLDEEVAEFDESGDVEELADLLEMIYALADLTGTGEKELNTIRERKRQLRGGFDKRVFLIETKASEFQEEQT